MNTVPETGRTGSEATKPDWTEFRSGEEMFPGAALSGHPSLEDVIPRIHYLAQHVGGLQRLAEIIAELQGESLE